MQRRGPQGIHRHSPPLSAKGPSSPGSCAIPDPSVAPLLQRPGLPYAEAGGLHCRLSPSPNTFAVSAHCVPRMSAPHTDKGARPLELTTTRVVASVPVASVPLPFEARGGPSSSAQACTLQEEKIDNPNKTPSSSSFSSVGGLSLDAVPLGVQGTRTPGFTKVQGGLNQARLRTMLL